MFCRILLSVLLFLFVCFLEELLVHLMPMMFKITLILYDAIVTILYLMLAKRNVMKLNDSEIVKLPLQ